MRYKIPSVICPTQMGMDKKIERWTREGEQDEPMEIYDTESMEDDDEEMSIKLNKVLVIHVKFVIKGRVYY